MLPPLSQSTPVGTAYIRKVWHNDEWYYSLIDLIVVLLATDEASAKKCWSALKRRLRKEGNQTSTDGKRLKVTAQSGKSQLTTLINTEQALRFIQTMPFVRVEPLKRWLAETGAQQLKLETETQRSKIETDLQTILIRGSALAPEHTLRLAQAIESNRAEVVKQWLAQIGARRLKAEDFPQKTLEASLERLIRSFCVEGITDGLSK